MLMLSRAERRAIVASAIAAEPIRSDRYIAARTGTSREMVAAVRAEMLHEGLIVAQEAITGSDGKSYPPSKRSDQPRGQSRLIDSGTVSRPVVAILTTSVFGIARRIDETAWSNADDLTRRTFRLACERLAGIVRRLDGGREGRNTG